MVKKKRKQYSEEQMRRALEEVRRSSNVKRAALNHDVPRTTLLDLMHGHYNIDSKLRPPTVLTPDEKNVLCEWLTELCRRGIPINKQSLLDTVETIIQEDDRPNKFKNCRPGSGWFSAFMKRHPELAERNAEPIG